jgi:uncharacterized protein Usg
MPAAADRVGFAPVGLTDSNVCRGPPGITLARIVHRDDGNSIAGISTETRMADQRKPSVETPPRIDREFLAQLNGYSLTTAEILYRLPDHPSFLQTYVWQDYDLHPRFPKLSKFLDFWAQNLDGKLFSIRVAHQRLIQPREIRYLAGALHLN